MHEVSKQVLDIVINLLGSLLLGLCCGVLRWALAWISSKVKSDKVQKLIAELEKAVMDGVFFTEQTVVKVFKENGSWNDEAKEEARQACMNYITSNLSLQSLESLQELFDTDDLTDIVADKIESALGKLHM